MLSMLAQIDPGSAVISSWFGTSLLGGVLYWLLFHYLPTKDKQMAEILAAEREANRKEREENSAGRREARAEFLQALRDQQTTFGAAQEGAVAAIQGVTVQLEHMESSRRSSEAEVWKFLDTLGTRVNQLAEALPRRRPPRPEDN
jgi:hypothetical protein